MSYPDLRDYEPIHPRGRDWRGLGKRMFGPIVAAAIALAKFSFILIKFSAIFVSVWLYALYFHSWAFGIGIVVLIFIHELGHFIEAKREGLHPQLPVFIPFLGAYVRYTRGNPWQTARVAIAGPICGGLAALVCYIVGKANGSDLWLALAYIGFLLNLINLLPVGILDGGAVWRSARYLYRGGGRGKATFVFILFGATALALAVGMVASHVPRGRVT